MAHVASSVVVAVIAQGGYSGGGGVGGPEIGSIRVRLGVEVDGRDDDLQDEPERERKACDRASHVGDAPGAKYSNCAGDRMHCENAAKT